MDIYKAFLAARNLQEELIRAHTLRNTNSFASDKHCTWAREEFEAIADFMGYRVEKIEPDSTEEAA